MFEPFKLLCRFLRLHRAALSLGALALLAESGFALALPYFAGALAESLLRDRNGTIQPLLLALFAVVSAQAALRFTNVYVLGKCSHRILADMRTSLYCHLQALPMSYFHSKRKGDLLAVVLSDAHNIGRYITSTLAGVLGLLLTLAGSLFFMWQIDQTLAFSGVVVISVFFLLLKIVGRRLRKIGAVTNEANWQMYARLEENLGLIAILKAFGREQYEAARFMELNRTLCELENKQLLHAGGLSPAMHWIAGCAVIALLWIAADRVASEAMSAGALVTFLLYATLLTRPVSAMADMYGQTQLVRASLARVQEIFDQPTEQPSGAARRVGGSGTTSVAAPSIEFRNVSFTYPSRPAVLRDFNLEVAPAEAIALCGENGAGKTTLVHLLSRYLEPDQGQVFIDGVDIATMELQRLRGMIGFIPQRVQLLNASIRDNIAYGVPDANQVEVEQAARLAQAHEFIARLPDGYDTNIGDEGVRLSGGQRQRIALARALLTRAPILIFDEATSMFDDVGERTFFASLKHALANKTMIFITHNPVAVAHMDRTIVLAASGA